MADFGNKPTVPELDSTIRSWPVVLVWLWQWVKTRQNQTVLWWVPKIATKSWMFIPPNMVFHVIISFDPVPFHVPFIPIVTRSHQDTGSCWGIRRCSSSPSQSPRGGKSLANLLDIHLGAMEVEPEKDKMGQWWSVGRCWPTGSTK